MSSLLERFQPPPHKGWVTTGEKDCQFLNASQPDVGGGAHTSTTRDNFPDMPYSEVRVHDNKRVGHFRSGSSSFLPSTGENYWKTTWTTWWDRGTLAALQTLQAEAQVQGEPAPFPIRLSDCLLYCAQKLQDLYSVVSPQAKMSMQEMITKYSTHGNWSSCRVRAVAVHPRLDYIAIARQDDELDVTSLTNGDQRVVLRDRQQVAVTCMQWAPHCDSLLAVGTANGVLLWHVDPATPTTRFVSTWVRYENSPGHTPITSLSWSPWGHFLISSSPKDSSLMLWDIPLGVGTRIRRGKRGGVANVAWSPDGRRVFAGNVGAVFHVWNTEKWSCEHWHNFKGRCKSGCWSSGGDVLLFAVQGDPSLYYITFRGLQAASQLSTAIKCADLSPCVLSQDGRDISVGGEVQNMVWDQTAQRLAVTFTMDSPSAELVAVFRTRKSELLEVLPGGFIRGEEGEYPVIIAFKPNYAPGALLVVVWSSGRISFLPLYFHTPSSSPALPLELVPSHTPSPHPLTRHHTESLNRPSLNRTFQQPNSSHGTPLYSVHRAPPHE